MIMQRKYFISIFTEDVVGMLNRVTIIFTRRHVNINSITASECEIPHVFRYTIVVHVSEDQIKKLVSQIEKQVDVLRVFYHTEEEIVERNIALFKVSDLAMKNENSFSRVIRSYSANIISVSSDYVVVEKSGSPSEIEKLFSELSEFKILEFNKSGDVAITKPMKTLVEYLVENNSFNHH